MDYEDILRSIYEDAIFERPLLNEDGKPLAREIITIPVKGSDAILGAIEVLGWLAYPDESEKRHKFVEYTLAVLAKSLPKNNPGRKRNHDLTGIPNKRIKQFLADSSRRITLRLKAADVLVRKMRSNNDLEKQISLMEAAEYVAKTNRDYENWADEQENINRFISRTLRTSKPVIHLALAIHAIGQARGLFEHAMIDWVVTPEVWLLDTLFLAERNRVKFGSMFPFKGSRYENWVLSSREAAHHLDHYMQHLGLQEFKNIPVPPLPEQAERQRNFKVELNETIVFLPSNCSFGVRRRA
ncbi:MAG: hypothetical protein Q7U38_01780 [Methylobacter sp.]|nr:hypothetical protein [Methylobacter sp.]MDP2097042.1 hypothetical protein [Methylobacter sp.]MDP2429464.1 hypothetical protein [Methylobacter sp.]MDP3055974.1 hypothetical protein [Methylobacter sp.]MDP3361842.1 hypothetical protein [Methylobacter sp.]